MNDKIQELSKNLPFEISLEELKDGRFDISFIDIDLYHKTSDIISIIIKKDNINELNSLIEILQLIKNKIEND